jgi:hypothetical protein
MPTYTIRALRTQEVELTVEAQDHEWAWERALDVHPDDWEIVSTHEINEQITVEELPECNSLDPNDSDYFHDVVRAHYE